MCTEIDKTDLRSQQHANIISMASNKRSKLREKKSRRPSKLRDAKMCEDMLSRRGAVDRVCMTEK